MASLHIHLAVGKVFLENGNIIRDEENFFKGIIEPDYAVDKSISHFSGKLDKNNLEEYLKNKVDLRKAFENVSLDSDKNRGIILHLITDYLFFNGFFDKKYIKETSYRDFCKDLYYSYDRTNEYIEKKYKLEKVSKMKEVKGILDRYRSSVYDENAEERNLLDPIKLDDFILRLGKIDLEEVKKRVMENERESL